MARHDRELNSIALFLAYSKHGGDSYRISDYWMYLEALRGQTPVAVLGFRRDHCASPLEELMLTNSLRFLSRLTSHVVATLQGLASLALACHRVAIQNIAHRLTPGSTWYCEPGTTRVHEVGGTCFPLEKSPPPPTFVQRMVPGFDIEIEVSSIADQGTRTQSNFARPLHQDS